MDCGREPGGKSAEKLGVCQAACDPNFDGFNRGKNAGRLCWLVAGTFCSGAVQGTFAEKRLSCRNCKFYKMVQDDEGTANLRFGPVNVVAHTHIGLVGKSNEDRYLIKKLDGGMIMLAVADGLGGEVAGDFAAELTRAMLAGIQDLQGMHEIELLSSIIKETDLAIREKAENDSDLEAMGSTLVCVLLRDGMIQWAHVGDSRLYLFRDGKLIQMTEDQTLARFLINVGEITPEQALTHYSKNVMDQYMGCGICEPETGKTELVKNDLLMLTTDGLHKLVSEEKLITILNSPASLEARAESAVRHALEAGGKDNITIIAAEIHSSKN